MDNPKLAKPLVVVGSGPAEDAPHGSEPARIFGLPQVPEGSTLPPNTTGEEAVLVSDASGAFKWVPRSALIEPRED